MAGCQKWNFPFTFITGIGLVMYTAWDIL